MMKKTPLLLALLALCSLSAYAEATPSPTGQHSAAVKTNFNTYHGSRLKADLAQHASKAVAGNRAGVSSAARGTQARNASTLSGGRGVTTPAPDTFTDGSTGGVGIGHNNL